MKPRLWWRKIIKGVLSPGLTSRTLQRTSVEGLGPPGVCNPVYEEVWKGKGYILTFNVRFPDGQFMVGVV